MPRYSFTPKQKENLIIWSKWLDETDIPQGTCALKQPVLVEHWDESDPDNPEFLGEIHDPSGTFKCCCLGIYAVKSRTKDPFDKMDPDLNGAVRIRGPREKEKYDYSSYLPPFMAKELGLHYDGPNGGASNGLMFNLTHLNDELHYTFAEIAAELRHLAVHGDFTKETVRELRLDSQL